MTVVVCSHTGEFYRYTRYVGKSMTDDLLSEQPLSAEWLEALRVNPESVCPKDAA